MAWGTKSSSDFVAGRLGPASFAFPSFSERIPRPAVPTGFEASSERLIPVSQDPEPLPNDD